MAIIFNDWCNQNEQRNYPLTDSADRQSRSGPALPNSLIVDLNLWLPKSAGTGAFVSSASCTAGLVSVVISAYGIGAVVPVCVFTAAKPIERYRKYPLQSFYPGAGGWIAFGSAVEEYTDMALVFEDYVQTELLPKVVRAYNDLPVSSVGKKDRAAALTGLVTLTAAEPLQILACTVPWPSIGAPDYISNPRYRREIDGQPRDCIALRLVADIGDFSNLYKYTGPCNRSPEDNQCGKVLLQHINGVAPDCNGNIDVEFRNIPSELLKEGGQPVGHSLDYPLGLIDVCPYNKGLNPDPEPDWCNRSSEVAQPTSSVVAQPSSSLSLPISSSLSLCPLIVSPYVDTFLETECWAKWAGNWTLRNCRVLGASTGGWAVMILNRSKSFGHDIQTFVILQGSSTYKKAYVIFAFESISKFWFLEIDADINRIGIGRKNGANVYLESQPVYMTIPVNQTILARVQVGATGQVSTWINGVVGPTITPVYGAMRDGNVGLGTINSSVYFDNFTIDYWSNSASDFPPSGCQTSSSLFSSSIAPISSNIASIDPGTLLLLHFDNSLTDSGPLNHTVGSSGTIQYNTTHKLFGTHSLEVPACGAINVATVTPGEFGLPGNFTIDFWLRLNPSPTSSGAVPLMNLEGASGEAGLVFGVDIGGKFWVSLGTTFLAEQVNVTPAYYEWQHIAITRAGNTLYVFVDGALAYQTTSTAAYGTGSLLSLGACTDPAVVMSPGLALFDEFEVVKDTARWTTTFTPPAGPYPIFVDPGDASTPPALPPEAPTNLVGTVVYDGLHPGLPYFRFTWTNHAPTADNVMLSVHSPISYYPAQDNPSYYMSGVVSTMDLGPVDPGADLYVKVYAYKDLFGYSTYSNEIQVTVPPTGTPPAAPSGLTIQTTTMYGGPAVSVVCPIADPSWAGETVYLGLLGRIFGTTVWQLKNTRNILDSLSLLDLSVGHGQTWEYKVYAFKYNCGYSPFSSVLTATLP